MSQERERLSKEIHSAAYPCGRVKVADQKRSERRRESREREEAHRLFEQAEALQRERQPEFDLLYSVRGFKYCDLILAPAERAAWRVFSGFSPPELGNPPGYRVIR